MTKKPFQLDPWDMVAAISTGMFFAAKDVTGFGSFVGWCLTIYTLACIFIYWKSRLD